MKRLLAYLIIVLGLGLTFNVNAKAEINAYFQDPPKYSYDKEFICFDNANGTIFVGMSDRGWVTRTDNIEKICDYFVYKKYHKIYNTLEQTLSNRHMSKNDT